MQIKLFHHTAATGLSFPLSTHEHISKGRKESTEYVSSYRTCKWILAKQTKRTDVVATPTF